jgi:hypothetical protein
MHASSVNTRPVPAKQENGFVVVIGMSPDQRDERGGMIGTSLLSERPKAFKTALRPFLTVQAGVP